MMRPVEKALLEISKEHGQFPPIAKVAELFSSPGARQNSIWVRCAADAYQESITRTLKHFADLVAKNSGKLGLHSDTQFTPLFQEAIQELFTLGRAHLSKDVGPEWMQKYASPVLTEDGILDSLMNRIMIREFDLEVSMPKGVNIHANNVGNLVAGDVTQSQLSGSVQHLVQSKTISNESASSLNQFLAAIEKLENEHSAQRQELLNLVGALTHHLELPEENRNPTTIGVIWEKIIQVSQVTANVFQMAQQLGQALSPFLSAAGAG